MSTLLSLRSQLRQEMRVDPNGRIQPDAILNRNINQAVRQIQQDGDYNWHFNDAEYTVSTIVSIGTYLLPSDFVRLEFNTVKYNNYSIIPVDYRWLKRTVSTLATDGNPSYYYIRGSNIGIYARPNAIKTLEFEYRKQLPSMSSDGTDSGLSTDFDEAIVQYASFLCWQDFEGKENKTASSLQAYNETMKGLFAQYLGRRDEVNYGINFETTNNFTSDPFYI